MDPVDNRYPRDVIDIPGFRHRSYGRCGNGRRCTSDWKWGTDTTLTPRILVVPDQRVPGKACLSL